MGKVCGVTHDVGNGILVCTEDEHHATPHKFVDASGYEPKKPSPRARDVLMQQAAMANQNQAAQYMQRAHRMWATSSRGSAKTKKRGI